MRIQIASVEPDNEALLVHFRCACGSASGRWIGVPPSVGDSRQVEFASDEALEPGMNVRSAHTHEPGIGVSGGRVQITACLLEHYEEGTVRLSFADGRIELETSGDQTFWKRGGWYNIALSRFDIYDTNV